MFKISFERCQNVAKHNLISVVGGYYSSGGTKNMQLDILSVIRRTWRETVRQSYDGKIWWHEDDVIAIFYSLLKPVIDQIENYELFWNLGH